MRIENELEHLIREQSLFEDSALEDASAYALKVTNGSKRFKQKENQDGTEQRISRTN